MGFRLGNLQFDEMEKYLGYRLTEEDKVIWDEFHSQSADLSDKESCFHVFHLPTCITFKGKPAKEAILKMFRPENLVNPVGEFKVYDVG